MLKIMEVHAGASAHGEYVVLQNQGLTSVSLRGWALCTDAFLQGDASRIAEETFVFQDDILIKPYTSVVLFTGAGEDGWRPTVDGRQAYCAYWGREERIWCTSAHVHILHVFASRRVPASPTMAAQA